MTLNGVKLQTDFLATLQSHSHVHQTQRDEVKVAKRHGRLSKRRSRGSNRLGEVL